MSKSSRPCDQLTDAHATGLSIAAVRCIRCSLIVAIYTNFFSDVTKCRHCGILSDSFVIFLIRTPLLHIYFKQRFAYLFLGQTQSYKTSFIPTAVGCAFWLLAVYAMFCTCSSCDSVTSRAISSVVLNLFHCWDPLNATDVVWDPQVKSDLKLETNSKCGE